MWTRAEVPCKSMEDLRAMAHEQKLGSNVPTNADDFFKLLKSHLPVTGTVARHVRRDELYDAQSPTWQDDVQAVVRLEDWAREAFAKQSIFNWMHLLALMT